MCLLLLFSKTNDQLLGFADFEQEVVLSAPLGKIVDFLLKQTAF